jgi:hypothetical protein
MKFRMRRRRTDFPAILLTENGEERVVLRDVSPLGLCAAGLTRFVAIEAEVTLIIRLQRFAGKVAWSKDREIGLTLTTPLPGDVLRLVTRGAS